MRNSPKWPSRLGQYLTTTVAGEPVKAFILPPLPPVRLDLMVSINILNVRIECSAIWMD